MTENKAYVLVFILMMAFSIGVLYETHQSIEIMKKSLSTY